MDRWASGLCRDGLRKAASSAPGSPQGVTGPRNFLDGVYGYFHLYGKDLFTGEEGLADLGSDTNS